MLYSFILKKTPKYNLLLYYPQHFNRSESGENPYFSKLIDVCRQHNISFLLVEEPDSKTSFPKNKKAFDFSFWLYVIIILRKILPLLCFKNFHSREVIIGKIIRILSFGKFNAKVYITISNSLISFWTGYNPKAKVYDLQHGIIYSWHPGYFEPDHQIKDYFKTAQIGELVYGKGFQNIFIKNSVKPNKLIVIGNVLSNVSTIQAKSSKNIVFTLQFTNDRNIVELEKEKLIIKNFLRNIKESLIENNFRVLLKNHPRYNNVIELNDFFTEFEFIDYTEKAINELLNDTFLHITLSSTSIFEFAQAGVPSFLVDNNLGKKIFIDEYHYPQPDFSINFLSKILSNTEEYNIFQDNLKHWITHFYEPFNKNVLLKILSYE